jgi:hypothetical protein
LTPEKVVEDYLEAIGGRANLESVTDISASMTIEMQGMNIESELVKKAPDKLLMSMRMGGNLISLTSFDGVVGKTAGMQGDRTLEGKELDELKIQALFMPELDYRGAGFTLELLSIENINGSDAYKLEITDPLGAISLEYYDVVSGYKILDEQTEETPSGPMLQSNTYEDYREVDGIMYPHKMIISIGPQTITATVDSVAFNAGVDDSVFK